jgi:prophage antirepressor-like protein
MAISTLLTNIYNNLLTFNNTKIIVLFDDSNNIWFSYNDLLNSIGYKDEKTQKKRLNLDNKYFDTFKNIYSKSSLNNFNKVLVSHRLKMINESGMYLLLSKSNKQIAKELLEILFIDILPSLRTKGKYILNSAEKNKMNNLTKKIKLYQKQIGRTYKKTYDNKNNKGFIYILKVKTIQDGKEKNCHKIGYTSNLEKRLQTYKTGNPDVELVHQENVNCNKKQLESCVLNLNILKRITSKSEVICDSPLKEIKKEIIDCKKILKKYSTNL